jgi:drug/metabolite transporter (DMT)-like permease
MSWEVLLGISIVAQAGANIFNRIFMRDAKMHTWGYAALSQIMIGIFIGAYAIATGFTMPPIIELWPWFLGAVILNIGSSIFQNEALRTAEASLYAIFSSSRILVSLIGAYLILGEHVTMLHIVGALLMLAAIGIAVSNHLSVQPAAWMMPATFYALCSGLVFIFDARILGASGDIASYMTLAFLIPGLITIALRPRMLFEFRNIVTSQSFVPMLLYCAAYAGMIMPLWLAYQHGGTAAEIAPLRQSAVVLTVILAVFFLQERLHVARKFIAALLAVFAAYLIRA